MGSWGGGGGGEREQDKAIFASLLPVNGKVSGNNNYYVKVSINFSNSTVVPLQGV